MDSGKPSPEGYLKAAKLLGYDPESCLIFEDANPGLLAAQNAGIKAIAVGNNKHLDNKYYNHIILNYTSKYMCLETTLFQNMPRILNIKDLQF